MASLYCRVLQVGPCRFRARRPGSCQSGALTSRHDPTVAARKRRNLPLSSPAMPCLSLPCLALPLHCIDFQTYPYILPKKINRAILKKTICFHTFNDRADFNERACIHMYKQSCQYGVCRKNLSMLQLIVSSHMKWDLGWVGFFDPTTLFFQTLLCIYDRKKR